MASGKQYIHLSTRPIPKIQLKEGAQIVYVVGLEFRVVHIPHDLGALMSDH